MEKYRARWGSTGHGEEVQGTVRKYKDTVEKYRAQWRSTGHCKEIQNEVEKYRAR